MSANNPSEEVQPLSREEWVQKMREEGGKGNLVRKEMIRLGFWTEKTLTEEEYQKKRELDQEYQELSQQLEKFQQENAKLEDVKTLVRQARAKRIKESKERRAKRKAEREEALAQRQRKWQEYRDTHILHVGENVSSHLEDQEYEEEKLISQQLPILRGSLHLAEEMGVSLSRLKWLTYHRKTATISHYHRFTIPKKSGGKREISSPKSELRQAQSWIKQEILDHLKVHSQAYGFVPSKSTVDNALPHVGKQVVVKLDLQDFFPSITFPRVRGLFRSFGYSGEVSTVLALLCTEPPHREIEFQGKKYYISIEERQLPQGACTSPAITNLLCLRLDERLAQLASKRGFTYSRYADDLTFSCSGDSEQQIGKMLGTIRKIVQAEGFQVNEKKTRVLRSSGRQRVTGVVVNEKPSLDRKRLRNFRALLHNVEKKGLDAENRENHPNFWQYILGNASYIQMVRPDLKEEISQKLAKIAEKYGQNYSLQSVNK